MRLIVALLVAALLGACSAGGSGTVARPPAATEVKPTTTSTTVAALVPSTPYRAPSNEIEPEIKLAASNVLQKLFSYDVGQGTTSAAAARLQGLPVVPEVAQRVTPLLDPKAQSQADIVYPQLGGLTPSNASVMAVTRIRTLVEGTTASVSRTLDVRLERRNQIWTVTDIASLGGDPVDRPATATDPARRVLDHRQIDLPDSARWDIHAGRIADRVLTILADIADEQPVGVTVLSTGHPIEVFGSSHVSNHIPGRGVDLWNIGKPVIDQRSPTGPLRPLVDRLLADGVTELGAPFDVDGAKGANFANVVHQDHLHVAFDKL